MNRNIVLGSMYVALLLFAVETEAAIVELTISGTIENSTYAGRDFDEGDPFTAVVVYDTSTPVNPSPAPNGTRTYYSNAMTSITARSLLYDSTYPDPAGMGRITVTDNGGAGQDWIRFTVRGGGPLFNYNTQAGWQPGTTTPMPNPGYLADLYVNDLTPGPEQFKEFEITLGTFDPNFIINGQLPDTFNNITFDHQQAFNITGRAGNSGVSSLTLNISSRVLGVPEPTTASVGSLALVGVVLGRRRRR